MNADELYRAHWLGVRTLRSLFNELVAYFDGQISDTEFRNLEWDLRIAKRRPQFKTVYETMKDGYQKSVQLFWEGLDIDGLPDLAADVMAKISDS